MVEFTSYMDVALAQARDAGLRGEVPVGAVIVDPQGNIIAQDGNRTRELCDPSAHAEMQVVRAACHALGQERLTGYHLYVTLEPCAACAATIAAARIERLYFGAYDPKSGGVEQGARVFSHPQCHHKPDVYGGIAETTSSQLLSAFFEAQRNKHR